MRFRVFTAISFVLTFLSVDALACGPWYYEPQEYRVYRASPRYLSYYYPPKPGFSIDSSENCDLWKKDTRTNATRQEIYTVVYNSTLGEIEKLCSPNGKSGDLYKSNAFARTLWEDKEAAQFLLLAKQCEVARAEMNDPWYYPSKNDPISNNLDEVAKKAKAGLSSERLGRRYALQATRAMLSLGRYQDIIELWNSMDRSGWDDCLYVLTARNVAGAYYNLGNTDTAYKMFCSIDDAPSMLACRKVGVIEQMLTLYELAPDSRYLRELAEYYHNYEDVYDLCRRIAREGRVDDPNFWYYTAAYHEYTDGKLKKALESVRLAERSKGSDFIKESAHVLRICIEAESIPYSSAYERTMFNHIQWLDNKIVEHLDEARQETRANGIYYMGINISFYYWNDMLRRLILGTLCPKLIKNHREVLALGLANMADNRLLNLVNEVTLKYYEDRTSWPKYVTLSMDSYRKSQFFNEHDYSNAFFQMIDTTAINKVILYTQTLDRPDAMQRYINEKSFTDRDYLYDLIGTRYLREGRYANAEKWLAKVSPSYQNRLNTVSFMVHDPFSFREDRMEDNANYKHRFAKEMARLERESQNTKDRDESALMMAKMVIGMRNSVGHCWPLAFFHRFSSDFYDADYYDDWENPVNTPYSKAQAKVLDMADSKYAAACKRTKDPETQAKIQLLFGNYWTVRSEYADTETAKALHGRCDNYYDYRLHDRSTLSNWWIDYGPNHEQL